MPVSIINIFKNIQRLFTMRVRFFSQHKAATTNWHSSDLENTLCLTLWFFSAKVL